MSNQPVGVYGPPSSWLVPAVVTTLCCMPITGVIAMYYASQVRVCWEYGDPIAATKAANRARLWVLLSFGLFVVALAFGLGTGWLFEYSNRLRD